MSDPVDLHHVCQRFLESTLHFCISQVKDLVTVRTYCDQSYQLLNRSCFVVCPYLMAMHHPRSPAKLALVTSLAISSPANDIPLFRSEYRTKIYKERGLWNQIGNKWECRVHINPFAFNPCAHTLPIKGQNKDKNEIIDDVESIR